MNTPKKQSISHAIDEDGQVLLRSRLPRSWKLRPYRPDYGLDYALEVFKDFPECAGSDATAETLGEHMFIQLKSSAAPPVRRCPVFGRHNVEKGPEKLNRKDKVGALETYSCSLETSELATVDRMGVGVPVLLIIADLNRQRCSFVCLNDYIDKILIPRFGNYASAGKRTIHVPIANEVGTEEGKTGLRWYAKRAKLFAAFQRFGFQDNELAYAADRGDWRELAVHFASRIAPYDFWDDIPMWPIVSYLSRALTRFRETGQPALMEDNRPPGFGEEFSDFIAKQDVLELWRQFANLSRIYEDLCREWLLPTSVGVTFSYE